MHMRHVSDLEHFADSGYLPQRFKWDPWNLICQSDSVYMVAFSPLAKNEKEFCTNSPPVVNKQATAAKSWSYVPFPTHLVFLLLLAEELMDLPQDPITSAFQRFWALSNLRCKSREKFDCLNGADPKKERKKKRDTHIEETDTHEQDGRKGSPEDLCGRLCVRVESGLEADLVHACKRVAALSISSKHWRGNVMAGMVTEAERAACTA